MMPQLRIGGDVPGHEFHGNQWTEGHGGGEAGLNKIAGKERFYKINQPNKLFDHLSHDDREVYLKDFRRMPEAYKERVDREMDITNLAATQESIDTKQVKELVRKPSLADNSEDGPPLVVTWRGREVVGDGHHRIAAALLRGETKMKVEYVDLSAFIKKHPRAAQALEPLRAARLLVAAARQAGTLRGLGDLPGHEFHGNQWTSGVGERTTTQDKLFFDWQSGDATVYDDMRNPKTALGKETTKMLETFPAYEGTTYRGLTLGDKDLAKMTSAKGIKMTLHSSTSKDEEQAQWFMKAAAGGGGNPVLLELRGRTRDVSASLHEDYAATKETVAMAGTRYRFERLTREPGYLRITLKETR